MQHPIALSLVLFSISACGQQPAKPERSSELPTDLHLTDAARVTDGAGASRSLADVDSELFKCMENLLATKSPLTCQPLVVRPRPIAILPAHLTLHGLPMQERQQFADRWLHRRHLDAAGQASAARLLGLLGNVDEGDWSGVVVPSATTYPNATPWFYATIFVGAVPGDAYEAATTFEQAACEPTPSWCFQAAFSPGLVPPSCGGRLEPSPAMTMPVFCADPAVHTTALPAICGGQQALIPASGPHRSGGLASAATRCAPTRCMDRSDDLALLLDEAKLFERPSTAPKLELLESPASARNDHPPLPAKCMLGKWAADELPVECMSPIHRGFVEVLRANTGPTTTRSPLPPECTIASWTEDGLPEACKPEVTRKLLQHFNTGRRTALDDDRPRHCELLMYAPGSEPPECLNGADRCIRLWELGREAILEAERQRAENDPCIHASTLERLSECQQAVGHYLDSAGGAGPNLPPGEAATQAAAAELKAALRADQAMRDATRQAQEAEERLSAAREAERRAVEASGDAAARRDAANAREAAEAKREAARKAAEQAAEDAAQKNAHMYWKQMGRIYDPTEMMD